VYGSYQGIALAMPEALRYECAFALRPESGVSLRARIGVGQSDYDHCDAGH
jgi:hypothetical protein